MKNRKAFLVLLLSIIVLTQGQESDRFAPVNTKFQRTINGDDGQYRPPYGDDGQYRRMNEGRYIPDHSGDYNDAQYPSTNKGPYVSGHSRSYYNGAIGGQFSAGTGSKTSSNRPSGLSLVGTNSKPSTFSVRPISSQNKYAVGTDVSSPFSPFGKLNSENNLNIRRPAPFNVNSESRGHIAAFPNSGTSGTSSKVAIISSTSYVPKYGSEPTFNRPSNKSPLTASDGKISKVSLFPNNSRLTSKLPEFTSGSSVSSTGPGIFRSSNKLTAFPSSSSEPKFVISEKTSPFTSSTSFSEFGNKPPVFPSAISGSRSDIGGKISIPSLTYNTGGLTSTLSKFSSVSSTLPAGSGSFASSSIVPVIPSSRAGPNFGTSEKTSSFLSSTGVRGSNNKFPEFTPTLSGNKFQAGARDFSFAGAIKPTSTSSAVLFASSNTKLGSGEINQPDSKFAVISHVSPERKITFSTRPENSGLSGKSTVFSPVPSPPISAFDKNKSFSITSASVGPSSKLPVFSSGARYKTEQTVFPDIINKRPVSKFSTSPLTTGISNINNRLPFSSIPTLPKFDLEKGKSPTALSFGSSTGAKLSQVTTIPSTPILQNQGKIASSFGIETRNGPSSPFSLKPLTFNTKPGDNIKNNKISSEFTTGFESNKPVYPDSAAKLSGTASVFPAGTYKSNSKLPTVSEFSAKISDTPKVTQISTSNGKFSVVSPLIPQHADLIGAKISVFPSDINRFAPISTLPASDIGDKISVFTTGSSKSSDKLSSYTLASLTPKYELNRKASIISTDVTNKAIADKFPPVPYVSKSDSDLNGKFSAFSVIPAINKPSSQFPAFPSTISVSKPHLLNEKVTILSTGTASDEPRTPFSISSTYKHELNKPVSSFSAGFGNGGPISRLSGLSHVNPEPKFGEKIRTVSLSSGTTHPISNVPVFAAISPGSKFGAGTGTPIFSTKPGTGNVNQLPVLPSISSNNRAGLGNQFSTSSSISGIGGPDNKAPKLSIVPYGTKPKIGDNTLPFGSVSGTGGTGNTFSVLSPEPKFNLREKSPTFPSAFGTGVSGSKLPIAGIGGPDNNSPKLATVSYEAKPNIGGGTPTFSSISGIGRTDSTFSVPSPNPNLREKSPTFTSAFGTGVSGNKFPISGTGRAHNNSPKLDTVSYAVKPNIGGGTPTFSSVSGIGGTGNRFSVLSPESKFSLREKSPTFPSAFGTGVSGSKFPISGIGGPDNNSPKLDTVSYAVKPNIGGGTPTFSSISGIGRTDSTFSVPSPNPNLREKSPTFTSAFGTGVSGNKFPISGTGRADNNSPKLDTVSYAVKPNIGGGTPTFSSVSGIGGTGNRFSVLSPESQFSLREKSPTFPSAFGTGVLGSKLPISGIGGPDNNSPKLAIVSYEAKPNIGGGTPTFSSVSGIGRTDSTFSVPSSNPNLREKSPTFTSVFGTGVSGNKFPISGIGRADNNSPKLDTLSYVAKPNVGGGTPTFNSVSRISGAGSTFSVLSPNPKSNLRETSPTFPAAFGTGVSGSKFPIAGIGRPDSNLPKIATVSYESKPNIGGRTPKFSPVSGISGTDNIYFKSNLREQSPTLPSVFGASVSSSKVPISSTRPVFGSVASIVTPQARPDSSGQYSHDNYGKYNPDISSDRGSTGFGVGNGGQYRSSVDGQSKFSNFGVGSGNQYNPSSANQYRPTVSGIGTSSYRSSGEGHYVHDDSGTYSAGHYVHDGSGSYVHDDRKYVHNDAAGGHYTHQPEGVDRYQSDNYGGGQYVHQPEGGDKYRPDKSGGGQYVHQPEVGDRYRPDKSGGGQYVHQPEVGDKYRPDKSGGGQYVHQPEVGDKYRPDKSGGGQYVHQPEVGDKYRPDKSGGGQYVHQPEVGDKYRPDKSGDGVYKPEKGSGNGNPEYGSTGGKNLGSDICSYDSLRNYKIIRQKGELHQDDYHYLYETENCMYGEEKGKLYNKGMADEIMRADGIFYYVGPDKVKYTVTYTADENGFIPHGVHLPTPPPIPAAILKSLEYQRSVGVL